MNLCQRKNGEHNQILILLKIHAITIYLLCIYVSCGYTILPVHLKATGCKVFICYLLLLNFIPIKVTNAASG